MHIAPGQGQTAPRGQNFDVNRKALSLYSFVESFIVGNPIGKKTLTFTFDGKIEYIILPVLILFLDMWQNTYGWMPSL